MNTFLSSIRLQATWNENYKRSHAPMYKEECKNALWISKQWELPTKIPNKNFNMIGDTKKKLISKLSEKNAKRLSDEKEEMGGEKITQRKNELQ